MDFIRTLQRAHNPKQHSILIILIAVLSVFVLIFGVFFSILSIGGEANKALVLASFSLADIPADMPDTEVRAIEDMKSSFATIENEIETLRAKQDDEGDISVNSIWLKCVWFARYYGEPQPTASEIAQFVFSMAYSATVDWLEGDVRIIANEVFEIVNAALYSGSPNATHGSIYEMVLEDLTQFIGADFTEPIINWRVYVTSEYGVRSNPTSSSHEQKMHNGLDIAPAQGTDIHAAQTGIVIVATHSTTGYGNHIVINHGGQVTTLYGHCSQLFVEVGDTVVKGQVIATVGSTGNSTGPHVHFETIEGGQPVNPRKYLP